MAPNAPPDGEDAVMGPHDMRNRYDGYIPVAGHDLGFAEDVEEGGRVYSEVDKTMLRDVAHTSWLNVVILGLFAALFVSFTVWSGLVGACKVDHFCEVFDHSTISKAFPRAAATRVPTVYLWVGLAVASLSVSVSSFYAVKLMRKPVGTAQMSEIGTHIYQCAHSLLSYQLKGFMVPVLVVFVLVGFGMGWTFSGGLLFGAMISKIAATAAVSIATRADMRTTAGARQGFYPAARIAFRAGSSLALAITGLGLLGNCAIYLMLEDVRVLIAFAAGASSVAFICRVIRSVYTSATSMGSRLLSKVHGQTNRRVREHLPLQFLHTGGDYLSDISGIGIDLLESFCSAISVRCFRTILDRDGRKCNVITYSLMRVNVIASGMA